MNAREGDLKTDHGPVPEPLSLDYRRPEIEPTPTGLPPRGGQVLVGFMSWLLTLVFWLVFCTGFNPAVSKGSAVVLVTGLFGVGCWAHLQQRWRWFLAGLGLGFTLTCGVPTGWYAALHGGFRW